jgi:hypothetical protein
MAKNLLIQCNIKGRYKNMFTAGTPILIQAFPIIPFVTFFLAKSKVCLYPVKKLYQKDHRNVGLV